MRLCDTCRSVYPTDFTTCPKDQTPLRDTDQLAPGMTLRGKYEILEKIGEGGMATVYRAHHLHLKEDLAIKVVSPRLLGDKEFLDRFQHEAVITRRLRHPNAVRLDDFDLTEDGRPFIVMEYVRGQSLRSVLLKSGFMPVPRALDVARQVALALGAAHALGIVHRDIKPDNVLLITQGDGSDLVKVLDFGIAKIYEAGNETKSGYTPTKTGIVLGTPQYLSPEQARGEKGPNVDGRADLYALGVMLYEMLTAELPFNSETSIGLLMHHLQTIPTPPHIHRPELQIPEAVSAILMKAMEKDRTNRFQTGEEFAAALEQAKSYAASTSSGDRPSTANFNTAALTAAAMSEPHALTASAQAKTAVVTPPRTAAQAPSATPVMTQSTKVLGSDQFEVPHLPAPAAAVAQVPKRKKLKYMLMGAGALVLIVVAWAVWPSKSAAPASDQKPIVFDQYQTPTDQPVTRSAPRTSHRSGNPQPRQAEPQQSSGVSEADHLRSKELTASGYNRLSRKDFGGASSDFQEALRLDPNNSSAQKGLQTAQAGAVGQGILGIFRR